MAAGDRLSTLIVRYAGVPATTGAVSTVASFSLPATTQAAVVYTIINQMVQPAGTGSAFAFAEISAIATNSSFLFGYTSTVYQNVAFSGKMISATGSTITVGCGFNNQTSTGQSYSEVIANIIEISS